MTSSELRNEFEDWAINHYSGFEGGNPNADFWFCGIEFGGSSTLDDVKVQITNRLLADGSEHAEKRDVDGFDLPYWTDDHGERGLQVLEQISKLVCVLGEGSTANWRSVRKRAFRKDGPVFKMNLFPIPFPTAQGSHWTRFRQELGFSSKEEYRDWCARNRFCKLRKLVDQFKPKLLVCFGKGHWEWYRRAFATDGEWRCDEINIAGEGAAEKFIQLSQESGPLLMLTPFFGRRSMTNDDHSELGKLILKNLRSDACQCR